MLEEVGALRSCGVPSPPSFSLLLSSTPHDRPKCLGGDEQEEGETSWFVVLLGRRVLIIRNREFQLPPLPVGGQGMSWEVDLR